MKSYSMQAFEIGLFSTQHNALEVDSVSMVHPFLLLQNSPSYGCTTVFFIPLPVEGHFGCFYFFAIVYKATVNIQIQVFV